MTVSLLLNGLGMGLGASAVLTAVLFVHHFLGPGPSVRAADGSLNIRREDKPFIIAEQAVVLLSLVAFCAWAACSSWTGDDGFGRLFLQAYLVFFVANLWDLIVLDWLLMIRLRPSWLELPDIPYYNSIGHHVRGWIRAHLFGIVPALAGALTAWWICSPQLGL